MSVNPKKFTRLRIIVHRPRTTAHPIELQTLFYSVTDEKADKKKKLIIN
jgi:hypothetical protein